MPQSDPIIWYEHHAEELVSTYETVPLDQLHGWLDGLLNPAPAIALDVGAGTGRDAAWLAGLGYDVVAVEPAAAMRTTAARLHPALQIHWLNDRLPDLSAALSLGLAFDLILLSAVWMRGCMSHRQTGHVLSASWLLFSSLVDC